MLQYTNMADPHVLEGRNWNAEVGRKAGEEERKPSGAITPLRQQAQQLIERGCHDVGAFVTLLSGQDSGSRADVIKLLHHTPSWGNAFVQEVLTAEESKPKSRAEVTQPQKQSDVHVRSDQLYSDETVMHGAFVPYAAVQLNDGDRATPLTIDTGSHGGETMYLTEKTRGLMGVKDAPVDVKARSVDTLDAQGSKQLHEQTPYPTTSPSSASVAHRYEALSDVHDALPMTHFSQQNKTVAYRPNQAFTDPGSAMGVANYNGSQDSVKTGPIEIGDRSQLNREELEKQGYKKLKVTIENGRPYFMAAVGGVVGVENGKQYKVLVDTGGLNAIYDEELYGGTQGKGDDDCTIPLLSAAESDFTLHDMKFKPKAPRTSIFGSGLGVASTSTHNPQRPKSDQAICIGAAVFGVMERVVLDFGEGESFIWTKMGTPRAGHVQRIGQSHGEDQDEKKEKEPKGSVAQSSGWNFSDSEDETEDDTKKPLPSGLDEKKST